MFEAVDLARLQFALTSIYHWLFVPFTLGMTVIVAILEWTYVSTGKEVYKKNGKILGQIVPNQLCHGCGNWYCSGIPFRYELGRIFSFYG